MWDYRSSEILPGVTSQKSKDLIYTVAEAWKHADSKYVSQFDSASSWAYSSPYCFVFRVFFNSIYLSAQLSAANFILFLNYNVWVLQRSFCLEGEGVELNI
jgi:hypothetical protein